MLRSSSVSRRRAAAASPAPVAAAAGGQPGKEVKKKKGLRKKIMKTMAKVMQGGKKKQSSSKIVGVKQAQTPSTPPSAKPLSSVSRRTTTPATQASPGEDHHSVVSCNIVEDTTGPRMNAVASSSSSNINYMLNNMIDNVHTSPKRVVVAPSLPETPPRYSYESEAHKTPFDASDAAYDNHHRAARNSNRDVQCMHSTAHHHKQPMDEKGLVTTTTTTPQYQSPMKMDLSAVSSCPGSPLKYGDLAARACARNRALRSSQDTPYKGPVDLDVTLSPEHSFESPPARCNLLPALKNQNCHDDNNNDGDDENEVMFQQLAMEKLSAHPKTKDPLDLDKTLSPENSFFLSPGNPLLLLDPSHHESDDDVDDDDDDDNIDDYILFQQSSSDKSSSFEDKSSSLNTSRSQDSTDEVAFQHFSSDKSSSRSHGNTTYDTNDDEDGGTIRFASSLLFDDIKDEAGLLDTDTPGHSFRESELLHTSVAETDATDDDPKPRDEFMEEEKLLKQLLTVEPRDDEQVRMAFRDCPTDKKGDVLEPLATMNDASLIVTDGSVSDLPVPGLDTEPVLEEKVVLEGETTSVPSDPALVHVPDGEPYLENSGSHDARLAEPSQNDTPAANSPFPDDETPLSGELVEEEQLASPSSSLPVSVHATAQPCEKSISTASKDAEERAQCINAENIEFARDDAPGLSFTDMPETMKDTPRFRAADLPEMANLAVQTNIFTLWQARENYCQSKSVNHPVDARHTRSRGGATITQRADGESPPEYTLGGRRKATVSRKEPSRHNVTVENKFGVSFMHGGDEVELELASPDSEPIRQSHVQNLAAAFERTSERVQEVSTSSTPSTSRDLPHLSDSSTDMPPSADRNSYPSAPPKISNDTMITASSSSREEKFSAFPEPSQSQDGSIISCSYILGPENLSGYSQEKTYSFAQSGNKNYAENPAVHNYSLSSHKFKNTTAPDRSTSTMNRAYIKSEESASNDSSNHTNPSKSKTGSFTFFHPEEESVGAFTPVSGDSFTQAPVSAEENQSFAECFGNISAIETRLEQPSMLEPHLESSSASFARRFSTARATNVNASRDLSISRSLGSSDISLNRSGDAGPRAVFALSTEASKLVNTSNSRESTVESLPDGSLDSSKCEQILLQSELEAAAIGSVDSEKTTTGGLDIEHSNQSAASMAAPEKKKPPTPPRRKKPEPIVVETVEEDSDDESSDDVSIDDNASVPAPIPIFDHLVEKPDAPGRTAAQATNQSKVPPSKRRPSQTRHKASARRQRVPQAEAEPEPTLGELFDMVTETFSPWNIHHLFNDAPWPSNATSTTSATKRTTKPTASRQTLSAASSTLSEEDALTEMTAVECTLEEDRLGSGSEGSQNYSADISSYDLSLSILEEEDGHVFSTPPKAGSSNTKHHGSSTDESPNGVLDFVNHL